MRFQSYPSFRANLQNSTFCAIFVLLNSSINNFKSQEDFIIPILSVYGIPTEIDKKELEIFSELMRQRTAAVEELKIKKDQVSIFFPQDLMPQGLGEEIIIFIDGLTEKPERTEKVKRMLVLNLVDEAHMSFPKATLIECIIRPYTISGFGKINESDGGFWGDVR